MSLSTMEQSLRDIFRAEGLHDWEGLAKRAMVDVRMQERNERVYAMKGDGSSDHEVADDLGISVRQVQRIVREQMMLRRANGAINKHTK